MRHVPFTDVICERALVLRRADSSVEVKLQMGKPVRMTHDDAVWACPYRVSGLEKEERGYAAGIDSVQALQLALHILPAWLDVTAASHRGSFEAFGVSGNGHGFAVPSLP
jgi:hypothetical protein